MWQKGFKVYTPDHINTKNKFSGGLTSAGWMPKNKINPFVVLFESMASQLGSKNRAIQYLQISNSLGAELRDGHISAKTARKILDGYNRLKAENIS